MGILGVGLWVSDYGYPVNKRVSLLWEYSPKFFNSNQGDRLAVRGYRLLLLPVSSTFRGAVHGLLPQLDGSGGEVLEGLGH